MKLTNLQINYIEKRLEGEEVETDLDLTADLTTEQLAQLWGEIHGNKKPWEGEPKEYHFSNPLHALVFAYAENMLEQQRMDDLYQWERIIAKNEVMMNNYRRKISDLNERQTACAEIARLLGLNLNDVQRRAAGAYVKMSWEYRNGNNNWDIDGMNAYLHEQDNPDLPE